MLADICVFLQMICAADKVGQLPGQLLGAQYIQYLIWFNSDFLHIDSNSEPMLQFRNFLSFFPEFQNFFPGIFLYFVVNSDALCIVLSVTCCCTLADALLFSHFLASIVLIIIILFIVCYCYVWLTINHSTLYAFSSASTLPPRSRPRATATHHARWTGQCCGPKMELPKTPEIPEFRQYGTAITKCVM